MNIGVMLGQITDGEKITLSALIYQITGKVSQRLTN